MEPDTDTKVLVGFLAAFMLIGVLGWKGCSAISTETREANEQTTRMRITCMQTGHPVLECEKLK